MHFSHSFSDAAGRMQPATIREISKRMKPGTVSFAPGMPAFAMFPVDRINEITGVMLKKYGASSMQYSGTEGFEPLRQWIAEGLPATTADHVQIVSGSQQAIDLMGRVFLNPGDGVAVSAPTYTGALSTLRVYGPQFIEIASDADGMIPQAVEEALARRPKFLYCIPNFMNPTGVDLSLERRIAITELARQYEIPILEDDPYGELRFAGDKKPSLYELAPDQVIYAGSFSKILAPGFRIGWMIAPMEAKIKLTQAKQTSDLQVSGYTQRLLFEAIQDGFLAEQLDRVRAYYYQQRNFMMEAMDEYLPAGVRYSAPDGGMFVWCELPADIDTVELLETAIEEKVIYVPGSAFYANGGGKNEMRLSFSLATEAEIDDGMQRLGKVIAGAIEGG